MVADATDEEVRSLTESILARYGLDFTCYEPKSLKRRIIRLLNYFDFKNIHELWVRLLREPAFIHTFMNEVSVGMTSMFRDPSMWIKLKQFLESEYRFKREINIWHSGCSSGEEVYSMGILLSEVHMQSKAKALATDINQNALRESQAGIYHKIKMIENERNYHEFNSQGSFQRYYQTEGTNAIMNQDLISHVSFTYHNLITDSYSGNYDIIFCRNVMIYFDNIAKQKLLNKFHDSLKPGGLFIIGFFDTLGHLLDSGKYEDLGSQYRIFRKK